MDNRLGFHCNRLNHLEDRLRANDLHRAELYNYAVEDLGSLKQGLCALEVTVSVHCPLVQTPWYPQPPTWSFLCDKEAASRQLSLRLVEETLSRANDVVAEYVVVHFPVPPSSPEQAAIPEEQEAILWDTAERLTRLSEKYGLPLHLEAFGPSPFLQAAFLVRLLRAFPRFRYCFDTGHMHIAALRDDFDLYQMAADLASVVGSIHLWNNRGLEDYLSYRHIPVHPSQKPEEGWVDIPRVLRSLVVAKGAAIIFESPHWYPESLGGHNYRDGVRWIRELLTSFS